ncbi:hydroxymethylglutaryl-CoA lyase [Roseibium sp. SCP14]|uniref:hydroxymethylglutaryl-CoA lyase n=1 Tax=Roseibium sp. SCP14 TaxID=3141375 RepID=UPI00333D7CEC
MTPRRPVICEVAPRDGFQSISKPLPTADKIAIIRELSDAGCPRIEIGSFVSPKAVPQMADMKKIVAEVRDLPARLSVLVPNVRGAELALETGMEEVVYVFSVSEAHNRSNVQQSVAESLDGLSRIARILPHEIRLRVDLATAFDCPFEHTVHENAILSAVRRVGEIVPTAEIALCDTTGRAPPFVVRSRFSAVMAEPMVQQNAWAFHGHDTFGQGIANALAAWGAGVDVFDTAAAGLGGCPFAPGATGNTATEDLVYAFNSGGAATGINLMALLNVADRIADLPEAVSESHIRRVPRKSLRAA